jgi:alcohol dehydrogenase class IV
MDALCQLLESFTSTGAQPMTNGLAREGLSLAGRFLLRAFRDGGDLEAREGMALAALLSGITLANAGLGAVHGIAAPLGACVPVPHGAACAALLPHVVEANVRVLRAESPGPDALGRYAEAGRILAGRGDLTDAAAADACVDCLTRLVAELSIPRLGTFGLTSRMIPQIAQLAGRSNSMRYNPAALGQDELIAVLTKAM